MARQKCEGGLETNRKRNKRRAKNVGGAFVVSGITNQVYGGAANNVQGKCCGLAEPSRAMPLTS